MPKALKYIVNKKGHKTYVVVLVKVWEDLNAGYRKLQRKLQILKCIRQNTGNTFEKGVKMMYEEYKTNPELTMFTQFDSGPFYEVS